MEFRSLSSLQVPAIGMGTVRTFNVDGESEIAVRHQIIANCISNQATFVDTSPMYGNAEEVIGVTTEGNREKFQLATKVWCHGREEGEAQIARSFQLLKASYVEVFQIHNLVDWRTHLLTLERLKEQGKVGLIGITHYDPSEYPTMMEIMRSGRIEAVQVPYNVIERTCEADLLPLAAELGIGVIVMRPLGDGTYAKDLRRQPDLTPLAEFGMHTWAQALLAWVLGDPRVSVAIPATSRPERIKENALPGSLGLLPQELREYIRSETERCL